MPPTPVAERTAGPTCPACRDVRSRVIDSRVETVQAGNVIKRRRRCEQCGNTWSTYEIPEEVAAPLLTKAPQGELRRALTTIGKLRRVLAAYDRREAMDEPGQ